MKPSKPIGWPATLPAQRPSNPSGGSCAGRLSHFVRSAFAAILLLVAALPALALQTVNGITINEDLDQARRGVAYNYTIPVISGGTAPYTFSLIGSSVLPIRLTLAANGNLSGVISCNVANGNYRQDVRVTDSSALPVVADFTSNKGLAINVTAGPAGTCVALTISPAALPTPTAGSPYSQTITASGGLGPYTYAVSSGALPTGLNLNATTGQISGVPSSGGAYSFTITATDAADSTGSLTYAGAVNAAVAVSPVNLPGGTVGTSYSQTVSASGGNGTYSLSLSAGALPAGLTFNALTGVISGTPVAAATSNFTITATDGNGAIGSRSYSVTVNSPISVNPATLPSGTVGTPYSQTVSGSGGNGSYTYAVSAGSLPAGLSLNASTGVITGTPGSAASSTLHGHRDRWQRCDRLAHLHRRRQSGRCGQPVLPAGRHRGARLFADTDCHRWQWVIHVQCQCGGLASRTDTQRRQRSAVRHARQRRHQQLHDHSHRWQRRLRRARLQRHHQLCDHRQPVEPAVWRGGQRLQPDHQRGRRKRLVHLQRQRGNPAGGIDTQRFVRRAFGYPERRGSEQLHGHRH